MPNSPGKSANHGRWLSRAGDVAYRAAQRAMTLDVTRLLSLNAGRARRLSVDGQFEFRFLSADEVARYASDPAHELPESFAERLQGGRDLCLAAFSGHALAGYLWLALDSIEAEQNRGRQPNSGVAVSFDARTAFVYHAFVRPEYRGRNLYAACLVLALRALMARGVRRLVVTADWTNRAALAGCRRAGFRELGLVWRFGWRGAMFTFAPARARRLGIRLGRKARPRRREPAVNSLPSPSNRHRQPAFTEA